MQDEPTSLRIDDPACGRCSPNPRAFRRGWTWRPRSPRRRPSWASSRRPPRGDHAQGAPLVPRSGRGPGRAGAHRASAGAADLGAGPRLRGRRRRLRALGRHDPEHHPDGPAPPAAPRPRHLPAPARGHPRTLADLAERTKDVLLPGRTHGQHAVPATFGFKVAVWIDELGRHVERLQGCEGRVFVAMLGGGAGTLASLGEGGLVTQDEDGRPPRACARCRCPRAPSAITRPSTSCCWACSPRPCSKIGREIYTLMKQEFGEVEEPVPAGTVGSSTMPQKRNPEALAGHHRGGRGDPRPGAAGAGGDADRARGRPHHQHDDEPGARCRRASSPATCCSG